MDECRRPTTPPLPPPTKRELSPSLLTHVDLFLPRHTAPVKANDGDEVVVDEVIEQLLPKVISAISEKDEANILAEEAEASRDVL